MPETKAIIGLGTLLQFGDGNSPEVFTTVAEVNNIDGPGLERDTPEATHMQSPDGYREYLSGLKDGTEVSIEANFLPHDPTQDAQTGILSLFEIGGRRNYRVVWPFSPPVTWEFAAILTNFSPATPVDDKLALAISLKVTGKPAFTA